MEIKIIKEKISEEEFKKIAQEGFGDIIKGVVDIKKEIIAVGGELHSDEQELLIDKEGSKSENLWGINIYPAKLREQWLEFNSLINIKPLFGNSSMEIESSEIKEKIKEIINKLVQQDPN